jgi:hypothetical protein
MMEGGSLDVEELSKLLECVVIVMFDEEEYIVSIVVSLGCNVDEVNVVKVLSLVSMEVIEYSESEDSDVEAGWLRLPAAKKGAK